MARRSNYLRPSNRLRTSAKLALAVAGTTIAALIVLLIIFFNLSKQENSYGQGLMVFESADVLQDTSSVFRGSINQAVLGLEVKTSGDKNPVKLASITFSASGTTSPVAKNIENARLWFTGKDKNFSTSVQIGQTLPQITENSFDITVNRLLSPGKNYFWLTYDIKRDASIRSGAIDAECISLRVGTNSFVPMLSSPAGKKKILAAVPYFSTGLPDVSHADAWNTKRDGSGTSPEKINDFRNCYFIQSGHKMTASSEVFLPFMVIEKHASFKALRAFKTKTLYITDGGIYQQEFAIKEGNPIEILKMDNGANYIHLNDGKLPGVKKYFNPRSNQCFYQYSAETFNEKVVWGNVLINSSQSLSIDISHAFSTIRGDLEVHKTGTNNCMYAGISDTINIGGSLIISGGTFVAAADLNTSVVVNVGEDLIMKSGNFYDSDGKRNSNCILTINGDVLLLDGDFNFNKCKEGMSQINFSGKNIKTSHWSQKSQNVELGNVSILQGKELIIQNGRIGGVSRKLTVENGATLMCSTFPVTGNGMFVLKENATIGIGNSKGINSASAEGNILTKERYFDSRANYIYYSGSNPQETGIFITSPENGTVKNMVIKKDKPADNVLLSQDIEVTDQLLISMGQLEKKKNKIILSRLSDSFTPKKNN